MDSLIAELEQAQEGSQRLDVKVCYAIGWRARDGKFFAPDNPTVAIPSELMPPYTTNLQDALGLVLQFDSITAHTLFIAALADAWNFYTEAWAEHLARLLTIGALKERAKPNG